MSHFVARAEPGKGWQIWNRKTKRAWGQAFKDYPDALLSELNGERRPDVLVKLVQQLPRASK